MTKEKVFELMKELVLSVKDDNDKLISDRGYITAWLDKNKELDIALKQLDSCEMTWLDEQYGPWFEENIKPNMPDMPASDPS